MYTSGLADGNDFHSDDCEEYEDKDDTLVLVGQDGHQPDVQYRLQESRNQQIHVLDGGHLGQVRATGFPPAEVVDADEGLEQDHEREHAEHFELGVEHGEAVYEGEADEEDS